MNLSKYIVGLVLLVICSTATGSYLPNETKTPDQSPSNPHQDAVCSDCHSLVASVSNSPYPSFDFDRQCRKCHAFNVEMSGGNSLNFHAPKKKRCTECHSFHRVREISTGEQSFLYDIDNSNQRTRCFACHSQSENLNSLSEGHQQAASLFHSDFSRFANLSASETCLLCHAEGVSGSTDMNLMNTSAPQFIGHGSHPTGVEVVCGSGFPGNQIRDQLDPRIRLYDGRIECMTCHSLSSHQPYRLAGFSSRKELCDGCHKVD